MYRHSYMGLQIMNKKKHHLNFHLHIHQHRHYDKKQVGLKDIPKGYMAVMVGPSGEELQQRFVIPVFYINHPLLLQLLKEAEEEHGFDHKGPITIPCHVDHFRTVLDMIVKDKSFHQHHHAWCFRV